MHIYMEKSLGYNIPSVNTDNFKRQRFKIFFSFGSSDWSTDLVTYLPEHGLLTSFLEH